MHIKTELRKLRGTAMSLSRRHFNEQRKEQHDSCQANSEEVGYVEREEKEGIYDWYSNRTWVLQGKCMPQAKYKKHKELFQHLRTLSLWYPFIPPI